MERKFCSSIDFKFDPGATDTRAFSGYGAAFNNVDAYGDVIMPGAFAQFLSDVKSGKERAPLMLLQHGGMGLTSTDELPIGRWTSMSEDGFGLRMDGELADTQLGRDVHTLLKMGAISGLSIGYIPKDFEPRSKPEDPRRRIKRIHLVEVSVVGRPANDSARVSSVKSIEELATVRECEEFLRDRGFSKSEAVAFIARVKSGGAGDPLAACGGPGDPGAEVAAQVMRYINLWSAK